MYFYTAGDHLQNQCNYSCHFTSYKLPMLKKNVSNVKSKYARLRIRCAFIPVSLVQSTYYTLTYFRNCIMQSIRKSYFVFCNIFKMTSLRYVYT